VKYKERKKERKKREERTMSRIQNPAEVIVQDDDALAESFAFDDAIQREDAIFAVESAVQEHEPAAMPTEPVPFRLVPLNLDGGAFVGNINTAVLLREIGGKHIL
jgi:hypothetical protein